MPLPAIQFDWAGWLSNGAWGSSLVSGASYVVAYAGLLGTQYFSRTSKTYEMLQELLVAVGDATAELDKDAKDYEEQKKKVMEAKHAYVDTIRNGTSVLGKHRARMIENGYDPKNPHLCEAILGQMFH